MKLFTANRYDESVRALVQANVSRSDIRVRRVEVGSDDSSSSLNTAERVGWIMLGVGTVTLLGLGWLGQTNVGEREIS
jgi:hypothetical protein